MDFDEVTLFERMFPGWDSLLLQRTGQVPPPSLVDCPSGVGSEWPSISGQTHTLCRVGVSQLGSADTGLRAAAVQPRLAAAGFGG